MSHPEPSAQPPAAQPASAQPSPAQPSPEQPSAEQSDVDAVEPAEDEDAPLNRAARRAKPVKQQRPGHVGPYSGLPQQGGRGPRSHSKRPR